MGLERRDGLIHWQLCEALSPRLTDVDIVRGDWDALVELEATVVPVTYW